MLKRGLLVIFFVVAGKFSCFSRDEGTTRTARAEENHAINPAAPPDIQRLAIAALSAGLLASTFFILIIVRMRRESSFQKQAIEFQAEALLRLNEELRFLNKNLEERIRERTEQLQVQNQKIAEYTFINAHKLRAPVASILGLINLFQQTAVEERDQIAAHLKACGVRLDAMIHELTRNLEEAVVPDQDEAFAAMPSDGMSANLPPHNA